MKHLQKAFDSYTDMDMNPHLSDYIKIDGQNITFTVQDGPVKTHNINGMQVTDILEYLSHLYISLNVDFPCDENEITIDCIHAALRAQELRTRNRELRGVEGTNKA